ncbi:alcohol dehydrogenase [Mycena venus]|uniref:Alcohol dehydrogenase n=1 Tax=Mycena venus TaxID=2733690 RepID=A0A8H6YIE0_9AGAR|nr:alcohol dehydrogenase [Mycena venus]
MLLLQGFSIYTTPFRLIRHDAFANATRLGLDHHLATMSSRLQSYAYQQELVVCTCTQCPKNGPPIPRHTAKLHRERDNENKLKQKSVPGGKKKKMAPGGFLAKLSKKPDTPPASSIPASSTHLPEPSSSTSSLVLKGLARDYRIDSDGDIEMSLDVEVASRPSPALTVSPERAPSRLAEDPPCPSDVEMGNLSSYEDNFSEAGAVGDVDSDDADPVPHVPGEFPAESVVEMRGAAQSISSSTAVPSSESLAPPRSLAEESPFWFWQLILITYRPDPDELRIGLCFGEDGFSFKRSDNSSTHTTGAASFCVSGLPHHLRYRPRNLLLTKLSPGPHDETADELQRPMGEIVTELLMLYDAGILVKTPKYPNRRHVRVILVCVCCDHPAMCKVGGFSGHKSNKWPCPRCNITHKEIQTPRGMKVGGFPARDGAQHCREAAEYAKIDEDDHAARDAFARMYGTRFFEFSRLPYFDPVRQIIVDPMHCIFLGIIKTQWFDGWVKEPNCALRKRTELKERELDQIHKYLKIFEMPHWVARLPSQVGYPSGGSLTADEWKGLGLVFCPLIIPLIWEEWYPIAEADYAKSLENWEKKEKSRKKRITTGTDTAADQDGPAREPKPIRMCKNDPDLLLKLAAALKIILGRSVDLASLPRAQQLLEDIFQNHPTLVKPNFHWITHIFDILRDFGPVYGFWTFLFERLNKLLKDYDTNNHGGGELEVTFFREFHRDANLREVIRKIISKGKREELTPEEQCMVECAQEILASDGDKRGTVAALAKEVETLSEDLGTRFSMGLGTTKTLPNKLQTQLLQYYHATYPSVCIVDRAADTTGLVDPQFLNSSASFHQHVVLDGRRIKPSTSLDEAPDSLVQLDLDGTRYVGQVYNILTHNQAGLEDRHHLLDVRWFERHGDFDTSIWDPYPELEIFAWTHHKFLPADAGPSRIIPVTSIRSQACRLSVKHKSRTLDSESGDEDEDEDNTDVEGESTEANPRIVWLTVGLSRDVAVV